MDIIFATTHLTVFVGGSKFILEYANKFNEHGHKITIVAQKIDKNNFKFHPNISLIETGGPLPSNPLHWLLFNVIKNKYLVALKKTRGDLLVSSSFPANFFCSLSSRQNKIKHVFYCLEPFRYFHDKRFCSDAPFFLKNIYRILSVFFKWRDIYGARKADEVICISNFVKKQVQEIYGFKSHIHYIGIETKDHTNVTHNLDLRKQLHLENDVPIILALGLTHHLKGGRELISIFKKIKEEIPNAVLLIGGWKKKSNEKIMRNIASRLAIPQKSIFFYGFIEQHLLDSIYQNSTVTAYPSINESYGYIPLESMKNGTPVVAFEGGPSDTIVDGQTGYIIKNGDFDEFAKKSIKLLQDKALRKKFSENAKLNVKINFDLEKSFLNLEKIFQEIISKKHN